MALPQYAKFTVLHAEDHVKFLRNCVANIHTTDWLQNLDVEESDLEAEALILWIKNGAERKT